MLSPTLVNQLEASLDLINVFINKNAPSVTKGQRRVLYRVFVRALYSWLIEADIPVNSKTLITNLDKLPGIVDRAFPGYIQAGLLGAIVSLRNKPTGYEEQE